MFFSCFGDNFWGDVHLLTENLFGKLEIYFSRLNVSHQMTEERKLCDVVPQVDHSTSGDSSVYFVEKDIES